MLIALCPIVFGTEGRSEQAVESQPPVAIQDFFQSHCFECHDSSLAEGDLDLETLSNDFAESRAAQKWIEILDRLNLGEMPPEDQPRPEPESVKQVVDWITKQIRTQAARINSTRGRVVMRRMTRLEYARTVSDLFSIRFVEGQGPLQKLPPDGAIKGFDRHAKALMIDPSLMDAYLSVAEDVAKQAVRFRPPPVSERSLRFEFRHTTDSAMSYLLHGRAAMIDEGRMVVMEGAARTFAVLRHPYNGKEIPETGAYRVRVRAGASAGSSSEPVFMRIKQGAGDTIAQFRVDASPEEMKVYETEVTRDARLQGEFEVELVGGTQFRKYVGYRGALAREANDAFAGGDVTKSLRVKARLRAQGDMDVGVRNRYARNSYDLSKLPKLYLDWIEVTGPLQEKFPPASMRFLFHDGWNVGTGLDEESRLEQQMQIARDAFTRLLPRAYRRKVSQQEVDQVVALIEGELAQGIAFESALQTGIVAVLSSPSFLFLHEPDSPPTDLLVRSAITPEERSMGAAAESRPLTSFELATRMSYFLWSSKPDDELMLAAASGGLASEQELIKQVDRMIRSARIEGFIQGFVRQWLRVDEFNRFPADERIFPRIHEARFASVGDDFEEQPLAMVREILARELPITDLIDSDWTMLTSKLAEYYDVNAVVDDTFQRVVLRADDAAVRGGLLGMAGVHRWGSDGSRTKPVDRGKYLLDVLFNDPPPPPPPNAGEVEPNLRGQKLSVRERLSKHREQTTCNHCHRRIDPYGLALENFNAVGVWREREDGEKPIEHWGDDRPEIDPSGKLMSGAEFEDFAQFKALMRQQQDRFVRGLTEKLLSYALARSIEPADRMLIDAIVQRSKSDGYSLQTILSSIVQSKAFRSK